MELSVKEIAEKINGQIIGKSNIKISGISDLKSAKKGEISFIISPKYIKDAENSLADVIISDSIDKINKKTIIKVKNARIAYVSVLKLFHPEKEVTENISERAVLGKNFKKGKNVFIDDFVVIKDNVELGDNVYIGAGTYIGNDVKIGNGVKIYPSVSIYDRTIIDENTLIHSGVVIGSDGFGFTEDNGKIIKIPQVGFVKIGKNVEIGSNCTIDRGAFGPTIINDNVKLDNLIHVAHNVEIGEGTLIAAQTGIAGSTKIGKHCIIGGQVGFVDHINIGNFVKIGSQAGVSKDIPDNSVITGTPARPIKELRRAEAYMMRLEELFKKVDELSKKINEYNKK